MNLKRWTCLSLIVVWAVAATPIAAQQPSTPQEPPAAQATGQSDAAQPGGRFNDQNVVVGTGFGSHRFSTSHLVGQQIGLEIFSTFMQQFYAEWYVLDSLGIGVRVIAFDETVTSVTTIGPSTFTSEADLDITNFLATLNWVFWGGSRYARFGALAGLGNTEYEYAETVNSVGTYSVSTSGPAYLLGAYVDWGADGFGARFGLQRLDADLDPVNGVPVDIAGNEFYLDLRWAF